MTSPPSGRAAFPTTCGSVISAVRGGGDPERHRAAVETLVSVYWRPVYIRLRLKWRAEPADAEDLTQEFFARAVEREFFRDYDPERSRFRTYLRVCLDRFASNARRAAGRVKRGGGAIHVPLDAASAERELAGAPAAEDADRWFDREWIRGLFEASVDALRRETTGTSREIRFRVFLRHDIEPAHEDDRPSYRALADEFGIPVTQVTNHLAWARRELRRMVLERLAVLAGSDAEVREEARMLFGEAD